MCLCVMPPDRDGQTDRETVVHSLVRGGCTGRKLEQARKVIDATYRKRDGDTTELDDHVLVIEKQTDVDCLLCLKTC